MEIILTLAFFSYKNYRANCEDVDAFWDAIENIQNEQGLEIAKVSFQLNIS